jgi:hypothetical protein
MGYDIRISGEILIDPPAPADEILAAGFPEPGTYGDKDVAVKVEDVPVYGVPDAYRRLAVAIVPCMSTYTAYNAVAHIQEIVDRWGEGRTFTGRFDCSDPQTGDLWRLEVHNGRAVKVTPRIVWPDNTRQEIQ